MALQLKEKTDVKIFILYLLMNIGKPIDLVTLNDIVVQDEFVNQFDFMDCLCELIDAGAVDKIHFGRSELYNITHEGIIAARTLQSTLLPQIREKSFRSAVQLLSFKRRGSKPSSYIEETGDGRYRLVCKIADSTCAYMETSFVFETRRQAERLKYHFDENAEFIYRGMLGLFSGEVNYLAPEIDE